MTNNLTRNRPNGQNYNNDLQRLVKFKTVVSIAKCNITYNVPTLCPLQLDNPNVLSKQIYLVED